MNNTWRLFALLKRIDGTVTSQASLPNCSHWFIKVVNSLKWWQEYNYTFSFKMSEWESVLVPKKSSFLVMRIVTRLKLQSWTLGQNKMEQQIPIPPRPPPRPHPNQGWSRAKAKTRHFPIRAIGLRLSRDKHELICVYQSFGTFILFELHSRNWVRFNVHRVNLLQSEGGVGGVCFVVTCKDVKISPISTNIFP